MKKPEIIKQLKVECSTTMSSTMLQLIEKLINECHVANESNRGEELLVTQGEIKAFRKIQKYFTIKK
jgi:hypothetical protein